MEDLKEIQVKEEILQGAHKLFQQYGYKKTTVDEIADASGKAKSTLYQHFSSKEEIFDTVIQMEFKDLRKRVKDKVEEHKEMLPKIRTYIFEFNREVVQRTNLFRLLTHNYLSENIGEKYYLKMMKFETRYITRILENGYEAGEFTDIENEEEIPKYAEMFLAAFVGILRYNIEKDGHIDVEFFEKIVDPVLPNIFT